MLLLFVVVRRSIPLNPVFSTGIIPRYFVVTSLDLVFNCKHTRVSREATFVDESISLFNSNFLVGMLEGRLLEVDASKFL